MAELPEYSYNTSIPDLWYSYPSTVWLPKRWAYGIGNYGSGNFGTATDLQSPYYFSKVAANNVYCITMYLRKYGWAFESIMAVCGNIHNESNFNPGDWEHGVGATNGGFGLVQWTPPNQYITPATTIWGVDDPFYPYYYNGWYEVYMMASEIFGYPRHQWLQHRAGAGHNPVNLSHMAEQPDPPYYAGEYPGERWNISPPAYDFRYSYERFATGEIYDSTAPRRTWEQRVNYLTEAFYWNYEQVGDYPLNTTTFTADNTLTQRKTRARMWYNRMLPFFTDFKSTGNILQPPAPTPDTKLSDFLPPPYTPTYSSKIFFALRPWWQRQGR